MPWTLIGKRIISERIEKNSAGCWAILNKDIQRSSVAESILTAKWSGMAIYIVETEYQLVLVRLKLAVSTQVLWESVISGTGSGYFQWLERRSLVSINLRILRLGIKEVLWGFWWF